MKRDSDALRGRFDLLVIGAGSTGAGVALDAALRGLRVALIDKGDFGSGTSSLSTKLAHGGIRYLEQGEVALVYEALHERRRLLHNAPHLVRPLRFVIPFRRGERVPGWKFRAGLLLYDLLAGHGNLSRSRAVSIASLREECPGLSESGLVSGSAYYDAQMDDARLCLEIVRAAHERGAAVCNYVEAVWFESPERVRVRDRIGGGEFSIEATAILNATGPWSDAIRRLAGEPEAHRMVPTKGVHLVTAEQGLRSAVLLLHPRDGRVFFVLPWMGKTLIGTTDTDFADSPDAVGVTDEDIDYLLEGYAHHFVTRLDRSDVLGQFAGVRPIALGKQGEPSARSREWKLLTGPTGMLSAVGGKWTTYRHMAEKITDAVMKRLGRVGRCRTHSYLLGAPRGSWEEFDLAEVTRLCQRHHLCEASARHLVRRYGRRVGAVARRLTPELALPIAEGEPDLLVELQYQRDEEMAVRVEDSLLRRSRLGVYRPEVLARVAGMW